VIKFTNSDLTDGSGNLNIAVGELNPGYTDFKIRQTDVNGAFQE